jgi:two-component system response regulator RegA
MSDTPASPARHSTTPSLLIADDDTALTFHLARAFQRRGFATVVADSYETAMNAAATTPPHFAVVDLRLGNDRGLDLLRDLLRIDPSMRVVMLTGYGSIATAMRAVRLGAIDYLSKPAHADDLLLALQQGESGAADADDTERAPTLAEVEWEHIQRVLSDVDGNVTHAAERLGIHRRSLQRKLARRPV